VSTPTEPNWPEFLAALDTMTEAELLAERDIWRRGLRLLEAMTPQDQAGHAVMLGQLRLTERALLKAKQDVR
jgi:hypothetical protein